MVKLTISLLIQLVCIILQLTLKSEAGIAGLIASAALMSMFRPKVIPIPLPLPVPVPVPVPIRSKSPLNLFSSGHDTVSNNQNSPYSQQFMSPGLTSPMAQPYLHPFHPSFASLSHQVPTMPFTPSTGHLMATHPIPQQTILPIGLMSQPSADYHHHHPFNFYRSSPFLDHHLMYHFNHINPSFYPGPFIVI